MTNGKICFCAFAFCWRADCLPTKLTSDNVVCIIFVRIAARNEARFKICDAFIKGCFSRVCSKKSKDFTFNKTFFHAWWVARGEICVLKGFSRLVMCSDVKDRFVSESFSFGYDCVEKCYFRL